MNSTRTPRAAPSFMVYAADDLARASWYGLSAGQRGLLESMARAYWVDRQLPSEPRLIALACRLDARECEQLLSDDVLAHFEKDDKGLLHHIELRRQLQNIAATRERQSEGGKRGAVITNTSRSRRGKRNNHAGLDAMASTAAATPASRPAGIPTGLARVPELKSNEVKELKSSSSLGKPLSEEDGWIDDYEIAERGADVQRRARVANA